MQKHNLGKLLKIPNRIIRKHCEKCNVRKLATVEKKYLQKDQYK